MASFTVIPLPVLSRLTDATQERNIYVHPNVIARVIFWQRLIVGHRLLKKYTSPDKKLLDFGGGSGAFLPTLAKSFADVSVVDLDLNDARQIAGHYQLKNVRLFERDIATWDDAEIYDVITAMDVLEHFADVTKPRQFIDKHLKRDGLLLVSLPTENWIYEVGRSILGKTKPTDHYHPAKTIVRYYQEAGYFPLTYRYVPRIGPAALPLFYVGVFRKTF